MSFALTALIEKHSHTLQKRGAELCELLQDDPQNIEEIRALSHLLAGSSGSLGFREYHELSKTIEQTCKDDPKGARISEKLIEQMQICAKNLCPNQSSLYKKPLEEA